MSTAVEVSLRIAQLFLAVSLPFVVLMAAYLFAEPWLKPLIYRYEVWVARRTKGWYR